jgi:hypothetical protein
LWIGKRCVSFINELRKRDTGDSLQMIVAPHKSERAPRTSLEAEDVAVQKNCVDLHFACGVSVG